MVNPYVLLYPPKTLSARDKDQITDLSNANQKLIDQIIQKDASIAQKDASIAQLQAKLDSAFHGENLLPQNSLKKKTFDVDSVVLPE